MTSLIQAVEGAPPLEAVAASLRDEPGLVLLHSAGDDAGRGRYSFLAAWPFLRFRCFGSRCEITGPYGGKQVSYGDPWRVLRELLTRCELLEEPDLPFPLGGAFGWWGYDLKNWVEPRLPRRAVRDLDVPDCWVGFHDSLLAHDHRLGRTWILSTGLLPDGSRSLRRARAMVDVWQRWLELAAHAPPQMAPAASRPMPPRSSLPRLAFLAAVRQAQRYIRAGDIYQVNLAQRLAMADAPPAWEWFEKLRAVSPAPYAAFVNEGATQVVSSSPELFLRLSGGQVITRPIKGTRPRGAEADADARLAFELQTSPKENAELVMITDLLRNDLGRICQFGSVTVPDLARLERFAQVQHLVSTVEGRLRPEATHLEALRACFPGGSVTGAPKVRAMEIIDELEPVSRGPYTGALGYLGFNRESQLSIVIRAAICQGRRAWCHVGAGIVADSEPEAEYAETLDKAAGLLRALPARAEVRSAAEV